MNDNNIRSSNVQYVASGLRYLLDNVDIEEVRKCPTDKTYRMSSGIIFILIASLASVVEGILKVYLSGEIDEAITALSEEKILLKEKNQSLISKICNTKLDLKTNKELILNILKGKLVSIEEMNYTQLKNEFKKIKGESFDEKLKFTCESTKNQKNISEGISMLFQFRNFIVHSNSSEIKFTGKKLIINEHTHSDYEFKGKTKKLYDYLTKEKLIKDNKEGWFIDQLTNKEILNFFFNLVFKDFLKLAIWDTSPNVTSIKNIIRKT